MPEMLDLIDSTAVDMGLDLHRHGPTVGKSRIASQDDLSCWDGAADREQKEGTKGVAGWGSGDALRSSQDHVPETGMSGEKGKADTSSTSIMHSSTSPAPWPEEVRPRVQSAKTPARPVSSKRDVHDGKGVGEKSLKG
ncbi:hypothetical protein EV356DRAFT_502669 [Viridothelium virens]|uniref:Uncharacterized protein n=1 Tax=Viridothelium virens TaxID=1048519 RepID=A0A6A6H847_VIRVR|nr:hypothetical protein EV356DRAFT_502669 [Viridothelium virens]